MFRLFTYSYVSYTKCGKCSGIPEYFEKEVSWRKMFQIKTVGYNVLHLTLITMRFLDASRQGFLDFLK